MKTIFRSTRVLHHGDIRPADLVIEHDYIAAVRGWGTVPAAIDLGDRLIVPGFIDLHSDAVEKEIEPRPGAEFPIANALVELDKKLAMSGITTMFHAIAFNDEALVSRRGTKTAAALIETIAELNTSALAIDNFSHARYEITSFESLPVIRQLIAEGKVRMLSLMDHSPGQGQFRTLEKWKQYHVTVFELTESRVQEIVGNQLEKKSRCQLYLEELTAFARQHDILLASHDDDSPEKVELMAAMGIGIAEFPLNIETARHARSRRMATGMGAPNIVRGKSQSGNISARELINNGCCDFLCSDYHPTSMLQAVYALHREMGIALPEALSLVTDTPASKARLNDRGEITPGKLADLVVIEDKLVPKVVVTIKSGTPIYSGSSCLCLRAAA